MRLSQDPGWSALLAAFGQAWGATSDGGSAAIRAHLDDVTARLAVAQARDPACLPRRPETRPVSAWLPAAITAARHGPRAPLARALAAVASRLTWEWGYTTLPEDLARSYGYCEILGPRGPAQDDGLILGFVLFAPGTFYPPHAHQGIFESYVSVAGDWAQNDGGVEQPGSLVFNPPGTRHFITTGTAGPCLLAYAWVGESAKLGEPGMVLD